MIAVGDSPVQSQGGDAVGYWDRAPLPRDQFVLIPTTLGDCVPEDHPVRVFHDVLSSVDWSPWERHYCRVAGQPAIPPMIVAGVIKRRQAALEKALEKARATEARRPRKEETKKKEKAVKVPVADPDAVIKQVMGLRRFLLRGVDKVRTEWRWACTAFNLQKLVRYLGALRARLAAAMIQGPGAGSAPFERKVFGGDKAPLS